MCDALINKKGEVTLFCVKVKVANFVIYEHGRYGGISVSSCGTNSSSAQLRQMKQCREC
jgi:hypothetical protein